MDHHVRTCKTWSGYTAAEIVASAKLETTRAGTVEIVPDLPNLNSGTSAQSGYLLHLTDGGTLLIESFDGLHCQMMLDESQQATMQALTDKADSQMLATC